MERLNRFSERLPAAAGVTFQPGDIVIFVDQRGRVLFWNDVAAEVLGYSPTEAVGLPLDIVCPRVDGVRHELDAILAGADSAQGFETRRKDGTPVALYVFCTRGEWQGTTGVVCVGRDVSSFWRAQTTVRAAEEKFRLLFNRCSDIVLLTREDGRIVEANATLRQVSGYSDEELARMTLRELVRPEARTELEAALVELSRSGAATRVLNWIADRGARTVTLEVSANLLRLEGGERQIFIVARDVTERLETVQAVKESEEKYRKIFEAANDAIFLETLEGQILDVNENASKLLGYSRSELLEMSATDLVPAEVRAWFPKVRDSLLQHGIFRAEAVNLRKDGTEVPVEVSFSLVELAEGNVVLAIIRDITERKQAEQALRESEEKYRNLVERATDGIAIIQDEVVKYVNPRLAQMWGGTPTEIVGTKYTNYIAPEELPLITERYQRRMAGLPVPDIYETMLCRRDGTKVEVELNAGAITYQGKPANMVIIRDITERKQAQAALEESEANFRAVVQNANDGILIAAADGRYIFANQRAAEITGYGVEELLQMNIAQLVHPSEQTEALQRHRLRLRGEDIPKQYETVFVRKDGRAVPVEVTGARTVWRGELANLTIIRDITKRKETEAALRASEAFSRTLIESTRDGIFCVDRQGRFTFVNDVIVRRSGRPREWWLGRDHIAVLRPQDQALVRRMFESVLTGEVVPPVAAAYETASGQLLHIELNEAPLFDAQHNVIGAMGVSRDITERQKALQALKESEERFRALVQLSPDGIAVHQDGLIVMVNPAGAKVLGYDDPGELIGRPVMEIVHPDDRELVLSRIRQVLEQGKTGELVEERFRTKSGSYVWVEVINGPIIWNNRPAVQVVVRDITEKKELLQRLAEDAAQTRTIIESAPHAVGAECEGRIAYANRIFAELFGYTLKEIIGMPVEQLIAPQDRERLAGYTRERLAGRPAPTHYTFQGLRRDGSTIDLEIYAGEYLLQGKKYTVGFLRKSGKGSPELKP